MSMSTHTKKVLSVSVCDHVPMARPMLYAVPLPNHLVIWFWSVVALFGQSLRLAAFDLGRSGKTLAPARAYIAARSSVSVRG